MLFDLTSCYYKAQKLGERNVMCSRKYVESEQPASSKYVVVQ